MASIKRKHPFRISFNAPAVLTFVIACVLVQLISLLTGGGSNRLLFSVYRASLLDPLTYLRLFGHVFGHGGWEHLLNNMMFLLIGLDQFDQRIHIEGCVVRFDAAAGKTCAGAIGIHPVSRTLRNKDIGLTDRILEFLTDQGNDLVSNAGDIRIGILHAAFAKPMEPDDQPVGAAFRFIADIVICDTVRCIKVMQSHGIRFRHVAFFHRINIQCVNGLTAACHSVISCQLNNQFIRF